MSGSHPHSWDRSIRWRLSIFEILHGRDTGLLEMYLLYYCTNHKAGLWAEADDVLLCSKWLSDSRFDGKVSSRSTLQDSRSFHPAPSKKTRQLLRLFVFHWAIFDFVRLVRYHIHISSNLYYFKTNYVNVVHSVFFYIDFFFHVNQSFLFLLHLSPFFFTFFTYTLQRHFFTTTRKIHLIYHLVLNQYF